VTQSSAGFYGRTAQKVLGVDHGGIYKFQNKFGGYIDVLACLKKLQADLMGRGIAAVRMQNVHA
jgi:hypothetical protein